MDKSSNITINNLSEVTITGVSKVFSATPSETTVEIDSKMLCISGENMEVKKLDVDNGIVSLIGNITGVKLVFKRQKEGFFKRIFK